MAKEKQDWGSSFDEALNKAGFAEFLAKNEDEEKEMDDPELMKKRVETFEALEVVQKEYKDLCKEKLQKEIGITLNNTDMKAIDVHVEKLALSDTKRLFELKDKIDENEKLGEEISVYKTKIAGYERRESQAKGGFAWATAFLANRTFGSVNRFFKEKTQQDITDVKAEILGEIQNIGNLHEKILKRVALQMNEMLNTADSTEKLQDVQERFEFLKNAQEGPEGINLDLLSELPEREFQDKIDEAVEKKVSEEIMTAIMAQPLGNGAFSKLEKSLGDYLESEKMGSKEGDELREMIIESIEEAAENLTADIEGKAKKLMLFRILQKARAK
ncbi:MAG: hypothetical protein QG640_262 [Patescibacteria group bacterium]|nr:hypothetical protein [Patescibacteria group bacterium]